MAEIKDNPALMKMPQDERSWSLMMLELSEFIAAMQAEIDALEARVEELES